MILHRSDLFNLTSDLPIQEVEAEHFKIQIADFNSASFIAFEEDGLLKILKNDRGACITLTCTSFLMAAEMVTSGRAFAPFPVARTGITDLMLEYFKPDGSSTMAFKTPPKPESKFILGYDPASKDQPDPVFAVYQKAANNPNVHFPEILEELKQYHFDEEVMKTSQSYGHQLLDDYNDEINSSVATAIELGRPATPQFPETLSEAIVFFDHNFHDIPVLAFQHTEIHFTTTFKMKYPEVYTNIKKSCGFWCEDSPLYKNLSATYKCNHEACLLNIILKGIYRYRNAGRDRSGDFKDVINSYKP